MNKFHSDFLSTRIGEIAQFVKEQVENLRSNNSKNALLLTKELCSQAKDKEFSSFVAVVLSSVLLKTVYDKNFIAQEAKNVMR